MAKHPTRVAKNEHQREFIKLFDSMCGKHSRYEVWADFVLLTAIEISNDVDVAHRDDRNKTYANVAAKYTDAEREPFASMLGHIVMGMEENPDQDFLGELYMNLNLGNDHAGQFFTPYSVCKMMAIITSSNIKDQVEKKGWIGVNDPACGAGATLIAFANYCLEQGINYQQHCLFVAQDIDYTVACMCYIQLSLMGCPGYVVIGNTLTNPGVSYDGRGLLPVDDGNVWYTPMFYHDTWHLRRVWAQMELLFRSGLPVEDRPVDTADQNQSNGHPILPVTNAADVADQETVTLNITETGQLALF